MDVTATFRNMRERQKANLMKSFGFTSDEIKKGDTELSPEQLKIVKALSSENPFEAEHGRIMLQKSNLSDIEKSDIMDAISYGGNIKIKKSGKEIKEQIKNVILPIKQAELASEKAEADKTLSECGAAPTKDVCRWWTNNIDLQVGYKTYEWEECRMKCGGDDCISDSLSWEHQSEKPKCNCPQTEDEAYARRCYNDHVQKICQIMVDITACDILTKNLKDEESIELTPQQVVVFKF